MFIGEYAHTIDQKYRLAMPAKFREALGARVVVTRGLDQCLFVYPLQAWEALARKLGALPVGDAATRSFVRLMLAGAYDAAPDRQGRITIPENLRDYAHLQRDVVVAGLFNRVEIWDRTRWQTYKRRAEAQTEAVAQKLGSLGMY